ncbi:MAG: TRAP transporter large permease [Deltaproteobacteria bacterium]|nr:TRAP transporter large permease [Deltaproteobacteria bacterium]
MIYLSVALGVVTLAISVPIFLVFSLSGSLVVINALKLPWSLLTQVTFDSITKYILLAIPLFIFSGMVMVEGGMARRLVDVFTNAVGHWRGGLGIAMVLTMGFFGALCGSILAAIVAVGTIMVPIMVEKGYPRPFVAALAACSGFLDVLIPPSNGAIIFCAITGANVAEAFAAGILPAFVFGGLLILVVLFKCRHMEKTPRAGWRKFIQSVYAAWPALMTPVLILGGIYSGLLTPTESAAVAGVWAVLVGFFIYRELTLKGLWTALKSTAAITSMIFAIIATATFLSVALTYTRFPHKLIDGILGLGVTPILFMIACGIVVLILGTFIEVVPIMYLTLPIFAPIAVALGIDLLHLMVVFTAFVGLGLLTPPVCVGTYTAAAIAEEPAHNVIRAIFPLFFLVGIIYGLILMIFPWLSTWLPSLV